MSKDIFQHLNQRKEKGLKSFAVLIDPDKITDYPSFTDLIRSCKENKIDYFFVGGSLLTTDNIGEIINMIKDNCKIPVVLFPGSNLQINKAADAILFLSLISGRNPDLLIGQHVIAAPFLKESALEIIPTGYMIVNSGNQTTVSYMSNTQPIPYDKPDIAASTAIAGELLGLSVIYMDAGSGAVQPIANGMISKVRKSINTPLIVGGGINSATKAESVLRSGADMIVIGNGIEKDPDLLVTISKMVEKMNS